MRKGLRIAAVFLYQEDTAPEQSKDGDASCSFFYTNTKAEDEDSTATTTTTMPQAPQIETETETETLVGEQASPQIETETETLVGEQASPQIETETETLVGEQASPQTPHEKYIHGRYNSVYEQSSPEIYDRWALDEDCPYDEAVAQNSPACQSVFEVIHDLVAQLALSSNSSSSSSSSSSKGKGKGNCADFILDAGSGTGRVGEVCRENSSADSLLGSAVFDGVDYSKGMLSVCYKKHKEKGVYRHLIHADLTKPLSEASAPLSIGDSIGDSDNDSIATSGEYISVC